MIAKPRLRNTRINWKRNDYCAETHSQRSEDSCIDKPDLVSCDSEVENDLANSASSGDILVPSFTNCQNCGLELGKQDVAGTSHKKCRSAPIALLTRHSNKHGSGTRNIFISAQN